VGLGARVPPLLVDYDDAGRALGLEILAFDDRDRSLASTRCSCRSDMMRSRIRSSVHCALRELLVAPLGLDPSCSSGREVFSHVAQGRGQAGSAGIARRRSTWARWTSGPCTASSGDLIASTNQRVTMQSS
jgi:hypothetical protein